MSITVLCNNISMNDKDGNDKPFLANVWGLGHVFFHLEIEMSIMYKKRCSFYYYFGMPSTI